MKRIISILILCLCLFTCCVNKKHQNDNNSKSENITIIDIDSLTNKNPFIKDGKLDSCSFIKLETNDACLIGEVVKVLVKDDHIFIKDKNRKLFVFDTKGRFLNTIGHIGGGPNELLSMVDFYVNEKKHYVAVYDMYGSKIIKYTYSGKILNKIKCDSKILSDFSIMTLINQNEIALSMRNGENLKHNYKIINEKDYSFKNNCLTYLVNSIAEYSTYERSSITNNGKECYASALFSDTIYMYNKDHFTPKFLFKSKLKPATSEFINKHGPYTSVIDPTFYLSDHGYSSGLSSLYATNDYLFFPMFIGNDYYEIFWNISENKGFYRLNYASRNIFANLSHLMGTSSDNALVCLISSTEAIDAQQSNYALKDPRIDSILTNLTNEDNPILGFYYIK